MLGGELQVMIVKAILAPTRRGLSSCFLHKPIFALKCTCNVR
jgi:hypothetical protein